MSRTILVGDTVKVSNKKLLSFGKQFVVSAKFGICIYHGNQWNDESELELVSRPNVTGELAGVMAGSGSAVEEVKG